MLLKYWIADMVTPKLQVVIFALIQDCQILVEKRPVPGFSEHQYLIPGGAITGSENLEQALKREVMEELGVIPTKFELLTEKGVLGLFNNALKPFVVTSWKGELPKVGLDQEDSYPLEWITIDHALKIPIESTKKIVKILKNYLSNRKN